MATVNKLTAICTQLQQAHMTLSPSPVAVTDSACFITKKHVFTFKAYSHKVDEQDRVENYNLCEPEIFLSV